MRTRYQDIKPFVTKDGSTIRELMHPAMHGNWAQSLAEAIIPEGARTLLHRHQQSEELYHVTSGRGRMSLNGEQFEVGEGDTVCIMPGLPHCIENIGHGELKILCCSAPPYEHDDTELLE